MPAIALVNQKGGVGKTTVALGLAASAARRGRRVLVVDLDPQANATSGLGVWEPTHTIDEALESDQPGIVARLLEPARWPDDEGTVPDVAASSPLLARREPLLATDPIGAQDRLRLAMEGVDHDLVLIDCPPSLGLLTLNALVAADAVLIPLHCEYFALEGLADLVGTMRRVRGALNPALDIEGVLLTMYDDRTNLGQLVARDVREFFKDKVFNTIIPRNVRLGEAPSHGIPAVLYDARSRGAAAYVALAREMLARHAA
jgi:chromosome partitioning protein